MFTYTRQTHKLVKETLKDTKNLEPWQQVFLFETHCYWTWRGATKRVLRDWAKDIFMDIVETRVAVRKYFQEIGWLNADGFISATAPEWLEKLVIARLE